LGGPDDRLALLSRIVGKNSELLILGSDDKIERTLQPLHIAVDVAWIPDGRGLFLVGLAKTNDPSQIWFQPYPSGPLTKVSNDLDSYSSLSVTADGNVLVSSRYYIDSAIYVGDVPHELSDKIDWKPTVNAATGETAQLTNTKLAGSLSCAPDGKSFVYQDYGAHAIYKMAMDGGSSKEVAKGNVCCPTISPDGKSLAFLKVEGQGAKLKASFVVSSLEGGPALKEIVMPPDLQDMNGSPALGWTPDGNAKGLGLYLTSLTCLLSQPNMCPHARHRLSHRPGHLALPHP
jgi:Tol biopolymer transport system component